MGATGQGVSLENKRKKETEVFGVTYDRYMMLQLHTYLTKELGLKTVVDMLSHGAKAAGSLYSIGFAKNGCHVTLVNPETDMMYGWQQLELEQQVSICEAIIFTTPDLQIMNLIWHLIS